MLASTYAGCCSPYAACLSWLIRSAALAGLLVSTLDIRARSALLASVFARTRAYFGEIGGLGTSSFRDFAPLGAFIVGAELAIPLVLVAAASSCAQQRIDVGHSPARLMIRTLD